MIGLDVNKFTGLPSFSRNVWDQVEGTIPASANNFVIDTLLLTEFDSLKYEILFLGSTQDDIRRVSMNVLLRSGSLLDQVYGKLGPMKIDLNTAINGSSFELRATNPEAFAVDYCLTVLTS